jgi:Glyoxalase-like domain
LINRPDLPPGDTRNADDSASFEAMLDPVVIDHVIYAHPDLDAAVAYLANRFGVLATGGGRHPARGTHNKLLALGARTYLEVIAPDPDQPEPDEPRPYGVEGISRGGLVGWALAVDDIDAAVANARAMGVDPGGVLDGHRVDTSGSLLSWRLTSNALTAGVTPFLICWGAAAHPAVTAAPGLGLKSIHIEHPDPGSIREVLAALGADVDVRGAPTPALVARIAGPLGEKELR